MAEEAIRDRIRGSIIGGAVGDALGYAVEFSSWASIQRRYGPLGIQQYELNYESGEAVFSDDTQMTLFTANGILLSETDRMLGKKSGSLVNHVYQAYLEWLRTQDGRMDVKTKYRCWLYEQPDLHVRRAPGNTCLSALWSGKMGTLRSR